MKKKVDERTIDNHPDVVFFDATSLPRFVARHRLSDRPVSMNILPSFGKAMFLSDDEQLDTKLFYVDEIDLL